MKELFAEIESVLPEGGDWCDLQKAQTLAALVVGLRPRVMVEVGVFLGGSLIPMLLAMKHVKVGRAIAIDPWARDASVIDQDEVNAAWWKTIDHDDVYRRFLSRLEKHGCMDICTVVRRRSDLCDPPEGECQLVHLDGNHGPQAIRDVERFAPNVTVGGFLILDDLHWAGGHVSAARELAVSMGFVELYEIGTGCVMQRRERTRATCREKQP